MNLTDRQTAIKEGKTSLGIEFGSTRIKGVLISYDGTPLASGEFEWESILFEGLWTYPLELVHKGMRECYKSLADNAYKKYGTYITEIGSIGISAMMHGYLPFDGKGNLLVPFRTWKNTNTKQAASELTELFNFNIPQRWSIAHLYQAILNCEDHVKDISFLTTLAGYVHRRLTGRSVLGVGDASGMFPIDSSGSSYNAAMLDKFNALIEKKGYSWNIKDILPEILSAGENAGRLTEEGALMLEPSGKLKPGSLLCPPEGDAGTGMVATNSVLPNTGNISAGTSVFTMTVLNKELSRVYKEIDAVTTPSGLPVAMVHCNNCTSDINAWADMLCEAIGCFGVKCSRSDVLDKIFKTADTKSADTESIITHNYYSGEPIIELENGVPLMIRRPGSNFHFSDLAVSLLYTAIATIKMGMDILFEKENIVIEKLTGHGGYFKTSHTGQKIAASAFNTPVAVTETAGDGGAWGIALLAAFSKNRDKETLAEYLNSKIFGKSRISIIDPDPKISEKFNSYCSRFKNTLLIQRYISW